ncbi:hypothetical protein E2562_003255 [Oryza meyeriana var. granulata]|uniref:Uncharacterized protein n=1 Tax=Oryza meyeriana var. granulata TaxID=110450 RepID=A0A6G1EUV5_9ORYZ|nr:hypothetical protein E2562_003255 [Oryza meyeriana var. granulata]
MAAVFAALETIETNLLHPADTRTVDVWAWAANPSAIPKKVWLIFTSAARDAKLDTVVVTEKPPEDWQHAVKFCVFIHLEEIHDYISAAVNLDNKASCSPSKRRLPVWHVGVADGEPVPARAFDELPLQLSPPRSHQSRTGRGLDRLGERHQKDRSNRARPRRGCNDDHPDPAWRRRDDDDDGRDDRGGWTRETWRGRDANKQQGLDGRWTARHAVATGAMGTDDATTTNSSSLLVQQFFGGDPPPLDPAAFLAKARRIDAAIGLGEAGMNEAWSGPPRSEVTIKARQVFDRLRSDLNIEPVTTPQMVESELTKMVIAATADSLGVEPELQAVTPPLSPLMRGNSSDRNRMEQGLLGLLHRGTDGPTVWTVSDSPKETGLASGPVRPATPPAAVSFPSSPPASAEARRLDALFSTPPPPILPWPAKPKRRAARAPRALCLGSDISTERCRSKCLAAKAAMERCQRVLWKRLGLIREDASFEETLADYVAMFNGPLPSHVIAALTAIFDIDINSEAPSVEDALLEVAREGVADLADEAAAE